MACFGPQYGSAQVVRPLRVGAYWEVMGLERVKTARCNPLVRSKDSCYKSSKPGHSLCSGCLMKDLSVCLSLSFSLSPFRVTQSYTFSPPNYDLNIFSLYNKAIQFWVTCDSYEKWMHTARDSTGYREFTLGLPWIFFFFFSESPPLYLVSSLFGDIITL